MLNTDAEGRLILADGLVAASEEKPAAIVDLATLTGAAVVALGNKVAAVLGNNDSFTAQVQAAADAAGEPMWPLPLYDDYRRDLDSKVADLKNVGGRAGGHDRRRAVPARGSSARASRGPTSTSPVPRLATPTTVNCPSAAPATASAPSSSCSAPSSAPDPTSPAPPPFWCQPVGICDTT